MWGTAVIMPPKGAHVTWKEGRYVLAPLSRGSSSREGAHQEAGVGLSARARGC